MIISSASESDIISIHALRGEGDQDGHIVADFIDTFQSTPSVGRATAAEAIVEMLNEKFQSTPSVGRVTSVSVQ